MTRLMKFLACAGIAAGAPLLLAADRNTPPPAKETGAAVSCIPLRSIRETRVHGDQVIDFHMNGKKVYRNTLPYSCPQLGFEERFSYSTSLSQLCSQDIITVLRTAPVSPGASCGLGRFQPVEIIKQDGKKKQ
ncbi:hypothetical protein [Sphingomonas sanxanigenens]|nr:hypothetical protein [Sphingomonas sanxanigenens]